jgi:hypothetical protein
MSLHDFRRSFPSGIGTETGVEITTSEHISVTDLDADAQIVLDAEGAKRLCGALLDALDILIPGNTVGEKL